MLNPQSSRKTRRPRNSWQRSTLAEVMKRSQRELPRRARQTWVGDFNENGINEK
jgi:hypothetical protein